MNILSKFKFALISDENFFSFFALDALSRQVKLIYNQESHELKNYFVNSQFIKLNKLNFKTVSKINKKIFLNKELEKKILTKLERHLKIILN